MTRREYQMTGKCSLDFVDDAAIAVVSLDDPPTANAMSAEMGDDFRSVIQDLMGRPELRAVIIRGAGSTFSIGGHRDMLAQLTGNDMDEKSRREFMLGFYDRWLSMLTLPVPVIAAIEGECIGVAPVFAFLCDIALADETTHFEVAFANVGLYPGLGLARLVPDAIGRQRAALMLIASAPFSGAEAASFGVVSRAVTPGGVHDAALDLARRITASAVTTVGELVTTLRVKRADLDAQLDSDAAAQARSYASSEFRERIAHYLPDHYVG